MLDLRTDDTFSVSAVVREPPMDSTSFKVLVVERRSAVSMSEAIRAVTTASNEF